MSERNLPEVHLESCALSDFAVRIKNKVSKDRVVVVIHVVFVVWDNFVPKTVEFVELVVVILCIEGHFIVVLRPSLTLTLNGKIPLSFSSREINSSLLLRSRIAICALHLDLLKSFEGLGRGWDL